MAARRTKPLDELGELPGCCSLQPSTRMNLPVGLHLPALSRNVSSRHPHQLIKLLISFSPKIPLRCTWRSARQPPPSLSTFTAADAHWHTRSAQLAPLLRHHLHHGVNVTLQPASQPWRRQRDIRHACRLAPPHWKGGPTHDAPATVRMQGPHPAAASTHCSPHRWEPQFCHAARQVLDQCVQVGAVQPPLLGQHRVH